MKMHPLEGRRKELYELYLSAAELHVRAYERMPSLVEEAKAGQIPLEELVDLIHLARAAEKRATDTRRILEGQAEMLAKIGAMVWVQNNLTNPDKAGDIQGSLCKGRPDVKAVPVLPKKSLQPEQYQALMQHLGVPDWAMESDVVRMHWPGMVEYATQKLEEGKSIPGIDPNKTYPRYVISTRAHKHIELDDPSSFGPQKEMGDAF